MNYEVLWEIANLQKIMKIKTWRACGQQFRLFSLIVVLCSDYVFHVYFINVSKITEEHCADVGFGVCLTITTVHQNRFYKNLHKRLEQLQ